MKQFNCVLARHNPWVGGLSNTEVDKAALFLFPKSMKVNLKAQYFSKSELVKVNKAIEAIEKVFASPIFWERLKKANFYGETSKWQNFTNEDIIAHIKSGAEVLNPVKDKEMDIDLRIFNPNFRTRNVVGYTYRDVMWQKINRKFFAFYNFIKVAGNIVHEWLHKMGFGHDFKRTARRPFSVCYKVQAIFVQTAYEIYNMEKQERKKTTRPGRIRRFFRWVRNVFRI